MLQRLHDSHRGAEATKRRAKQTVFWPGINSDITNTVRACEACQMLLPNQQREEYRNDDHHTLTYESISADHFQITGKYFLVIVDRLFGWPVVFLVVQILRHLPPFHTSASSSVITAPQSDYAAMEDPSLQRRPLQTSYNAERSTTSSRHLIIPNPTYTPRLLSSR